MKSNLMISCLALCALPMYLHAGTGQDPKTYQPAAQTQNTRTADAILAGTILPVRLNSELRSDKSPNRATITATVMQDVPLGKGERLRKGTKLAGHVVETIPPGRGSDESKISFQFDQVRLGNRAVPMSTTLRAVASRSEVFAATPKPTSSEYADNQIEIGGDQISYGEGEPVMVGSQVVGRYTSQGVLANGDPDSGTPRGVAIADEVRPRAFWLFSVNGRGVYGFGDLTILRSGRTSPIGEVTLASTRKAVKVAKGSAMLLCVDGSAPEKAQAQTILSRRIGQ